MAYELRRFSGVVPMRVAQGSGEFSIIGMTSCGAGQDSLTVRSSISSRGDSMFVSTFIPVWPEFLVAMTSTGALTASAISFMQ